jgi:anti-anti-sigma regulatory factor
VKTSIDRVSDSEAVLGLDGELDASNYRDLMTAGEELYADGVRTLVLDMSDLEYMSSSGIVALHSLALVYRGQAPHDPDAGWEALHAAQADAEAGDRYEQLRLAGPGEDISVVLERTGMSAIMPVFPDRDAALAGPNS